jgi:ribosomal protein RSM22 (predicted rRNA methylase)
MVDTTDIEKKSLEAHVELCAERYRYLEEKLDSLESRSIENNKMISDIKSMVQTVVNKRNDQIISWGTAIIGSLVASVVYLVIQYVIK